MTNENQSGEVPASSTDQVKDPLGVIGISEILRFVEDEGASINEGLDQLEAKGLYLYSPSEETLDSVIKAAEASGKQELIKRIVEAVTERRAAQAATSQELT
jgi:hypothetical protein